MKKNGMKNKPQQGVDMKEKLFLSMKWKPIGEFRFSEKNTAFIAETTSHLYSQPVVFVLAFFKDNTCALSIFNNKDLSELSRYENISTFTYNCKGLFKFTKKQAKEVLKDIEWVIDTVDKYAESWQNDNE